MRPLLAYVLSLLLVSPLFVSCGSSQSSSDSNSNNNDTDVATDTFNPMDASIAETHAALRSGQTTCRALVEFYLDRILKFDLDVSDGPPLNALVRINTNARAIAADLDEHFRLTGQFVGPLHCIVTIIKDNYDAFDMPTTAGSLAFVDPVSGEEQQPPDDGFQTALYRQAGAVILGHGSMDELAVGIHGKSSRSGRTGNAYDAFRNPGGSSSGPAVSVTSNFSMIGTGSDTCGSNRMPASFNNLVSIRQSSGLSSQDGVYPLFLPNDVEGPMARSIGDLATMLNVIAVQDPSDPKTQDPEWQRPNDFTDFLNPKGLDGKRIGILRSTGGSATFEGASDEVLGVYQTVFDTLTAQGAEVIDNIELPDFDILPPLTGIASDINAYLSSFATLQQDYADVCQSDRSITGPITGYPFSDVPVAISPFPYATLTCEAFQLATSNTGTPVYDTDVARLETNRQYVENIMDQNNLDGLIYPTVPTGAAQFAGENGKGDAGVPVANCIVAANSGLPSIVVRAGFSNDSIALPIGIQILGRKFDEATLIEMAFAYENVTQLRQQPILISEVASQTLPAMDIDEFNRVKLAIAEAAFPVMANNGSPDGSLLTAEVFQPIVLDQLQKSKFSFLVPAD